jgi:hypothetical protein
MLSIIIPARTEKFLNNTIQDILFKATGEIEIFPVLDGYGDYPYEPIIDKRVKYISLPLPLNYERRKRQGINAGVSISHGKYVMWCDAHCCFEKGFDEVLVKDCQDDWVVVPRRYKLNPEKWDKEDWEDRPPIDYEYWMWQKITKAKIFSGYRWNQKSLEKKDIPIDDIFTAQGSFFFMSRKWFDYCKFMKVEGYTGWGQEGEEVCMTTLLNGGRAVVNKNTWYSHMHKGQMHGRMYKWTNVQPSYDYAYNYWIHEQKEFFIKLIDRFGLFPNWPETWQKHIYG